jgi:hypothetical protein
MLQEAVNMRNLIQQEKHYAAAICDGGLQTHDAAGDALASRPLSLLRHRELDHGLELTAEWRRAHQL